MLVSPGDVYGFLSVIKELPRKKYNNCGRKFKKRMFRLLCSCGKKTTCALGDLRAKKIISCGCQRGKHSTDKISILNRREYRTWSSMKNRCSNKNSASYPTYGGRGIKVCDEWKSSFRTFLSDMGKRPDGDYSLDRIDVNGNYEPANCRWADRETQSRNKRCTCGCGHCCKTKKETF